MKKKKVADNTYSMCILKRWGYVCIYYLDVEISLAYDPTQKEFILVTSECLE